MESNDYKSKTAVIDYLSNLEPTEGEVLIGKTVKNLIAEEYGLTLIFTDGSSLKISGHTYDGCALSVELNK